MSRLFTRVVVSLLLVLFWGAAAAADTYQTEIGFTQLQTELGSSIPTGAGVAVTQVEADTQANSNYYTYLPDPTNAEFNLKNFTFHIVYKDMAY